MRLMRSVVLVGAMLALSVACVPQKRDPIVTMPPPLKLLSLPPSAVPLDAAYWMRLERDAPPRRDEIRDGYRYDWSVVATAVDNVEYMAYRPERYRLPVGFALTNDGSPIVNQRGLLQSGGAQRRYEFIFPDRARENIFLRVSDDVALSGRYSHDNMFRELHFFPRRQLPSLERSKNGERLDVTLPTGERVSFHAETMEIAGGVLDEAPIDFTRSRYERLNPQVSYHGNYLMVTVAQRGEAPRRSTVWGQAKQARAHYPAKYPEPCSLPPGKLWSQEMIDGDPSLQPLHARDDSLIATIERQCGWELSDLRESDAAGPSIVGVD